MNLNEWLPESEDVQSSEEDAKPQSRAAMPTNDELPGACRIQSPSSILTHRQCPRKYYFRYIEKLPGPKSIHLIRGSVVHKVLEDAYDVDVSRIPAKSFFHTIRIVLQEMFRKEWVAASHQLAELSLSPEELEEYREETQLMIDNFYHYVYDRMQPLIASMSPQEAWKKITPEREVLMKSAQHLVRGYIDVVSKELDGTTLILDYKTSKKLDITPEYRLQLGIYAMMQEEHHTTPDEVGIIFLKHGKELRLPVTPDLVEDARQACSEVQLHTQSTNQADYPKRPGPLCKWRTGQCEYYDLCFQGMSVPEYREKMKFTRS